ncbi:MAG: hypothetical protein IH897_05115 [Planctomycetes bacterium]|nr:hypothetical protein [Planctomycetota bacterium]
MLIFWPIRYLDSRDKQFKDRHLWLVTDELEPADRVAVELCYQLQESGCAGREMLRYRNLFREQTQLEADRSELIRRHGGMESVFFLHDYIEDENGDELSRKRMAVILTSHPESVMFPPHARQHDIDLALAEKSPVSIDKIALAEKDLLILGYFVRDLREMRASAFFREGAGVLKSSAATEPYLYTSVTDEEIRSFVVIFRRLYMTGEPASFLKAVAVLDEAAKDHPLANWVCGERSEYDTDLAKRPDFIPFEGRENWSFTVKRLIDVFLYTQYMHQPDEKRTRQFEECLQAIGGNQDTLMWLFLTELWKCSLHISNAGNIIANFYERYCEHHEVAGCILGSVSKEIAGIGTVEKKEARRERILGEKAEELAKAMWERDGCPEGGCARYVAKARADLTATIDGNDEQSEVT